MKQNLIRIYLAHILRLKAPPLCNFCAFEDLLQFPFIVPLNIEISKRDCKVFDDIKMMPKNLAPLFLMSSSFTGECLMLKILIVFHQAKCYDKRGYSD